MMRLLIAAATAATVATASLTAAQAADPAAYVEYRKEALKATGGHMKAMATLMKSGIEVPNHIADHATAIAFILETMPAAFPEGTAGIADTEALDKIWSNMDTFKKGWEKSAEAANALVAAANSGDQKAMGEALKDLGGTCKTCHENFRKD